GRRLHGGIAPVARPGSRPQRRSSPGLTAKSRPVLSCYIVCCPDEKGTRKLPIQGRILTTRPGRGTPPRPARFPPTPPPAAVPTPPPAAAVVRWQSPKRN